MNALLERIHEQAMESITADVIMVQGSSFFHSHKLRNQLDYKVYLHSDSDKRLANYLTYTKGHQSFETAMQKYFEEVKPKDSSTLQSEEHADFKVQKADAEEVKGFVSEELKLLGLIIKDLCLAKKGDGSVADL
ncbi:unnamed protein product [Anisakis simplex]|uniref:PRK domain-containing protein n=1 Tax=Anisakis simplex TaxID=6269 RepID=A0A0M3KH03_ANISI|nr:unnamed protein product [Anisakis simplex]